mgnify:CR=1 FL=1
MKRIFIGSKININNDIYDEIVRDFDGIVNGKWVEPYNLHITYKFIGDIEENLIPIIKGLLVEELKKYKVSLRLEGIGFFPRLSYAKILYIGLNEKNNLLLKYNKIIENKLSEIGIPRSNKKFQSHITLCRIKSFESTPLQEIADLYKDKHFQLIESLEINIFESKLTKSGPIYSIL